MSSPDPRTLRASLLLATCLACLAGCATTMPPHRFTATDFGVGFVDRGTTQTSAEELQQAADRQLAILQHVMRAAPEILQPLPEPTRSASLTAVKSVVATLGDRVKGQVEAGIKSNAKAVGNYLSTYDLFDRSGSEYRYEQIPMLSASDPEASGLNPLITKSNGLLRQASLVAQTVKVEQTYLARANTDLEAGPDSSKMAGIGIICTSATLGALKALRDANKLWPQLNATLRQARSWAKARPDLNAKLHQTVTALSLAFSNNAKVMSQAPALLDKVQLTVGALTGSSPAAADTAVAQTPPPASTAVQPSTGPAAPLSASATPPVAHRAVYHPRAVAREPRKPVFVIAFGADDSASVQAAQLKAFVQSAIQKSRDYGLVDALAIFDPTGTQERSDELQKGDDALSYGTKSYVNLDEGLGLESFERAISAYEQSPLWDQQTFHKLTTALAMRVLVRWAEDPVSTRTELRRVLTLDPKANFPKEWTPPDMAIEAAHIREGLPYEVPVSLDVSTDPVSAQVYVDGIYRGVTPMSVKELNPGDHYLSLLAPGFEVVQRLVKAEPGATVNQTLKPTTRGQGLLTFLGQIKQQFRQELEINRAKFLGATTGAAQVIVMRVTRGTGQLSLELHRISVKDGSVLQEVDMKDIPDTDLDFRQAERAATRKLFASDRKCDEGPCPFITHLQAPKIPWGTIKATTGISAAAIFATGVILGVVARTKDVQFQKLTQVDPTLPSVGATVRHEALAADVLMGVGLAGAVAWGYMQFGLPYMQRTAIQDQPVLEKDQPQNQKKPPPAKKPPDDADDPFDASVDSPPSLLSKLPAPFAAPLPSGWTFGVQGSF